MDDKLLVRTYDVGFGDCIYVQIPDGDDRFHMLIDCGTSASADILKAVVDDVRADLPLEGGKRRLDLLVATHPHADHIKGFDPTWFEDVTIGRIWLTVFLEPDHPEAKKMRAFQNLANDAAHGLLERSGLALAPGVRSLLARSIWNPGALKALREDLAKASGIDAHYPLYVTRDLADRQSPEKRDRYKLDFQQGTTCFRGFQEPGTCLRVLAPEWDIDKYYLGQGSFDDNPLADQCLFQTEAYKASSQTLDQAGGAAIQAEGAPAAKTVQPGNISAQDFRQLRSRLLYSGLAFSQKDDRLKNNTSVVLLLEWRGRRLLFAGDAEWQGAGVEEDRRNGTWDVMLNIPEVKQVLLQPLDLLKVAHHGSHNGTPFLKGGKEEVLDKILSPDRTQVVVSTVTGVHGDEMPVPYAPLLETLGGLAANKRRYPHAPEPELRDKDQPQRTDLEPPVPGEEVRYTEVTLLGK
jgi:beta-lactamase superfamily II metal-dependent hydrolase